MGESQTGPTVPSPAQPDEASWAPTLPPALRQATLDYIRPLSATWHPHRRRLLTLRRWGEVRRFWEWLCARRTVIQPCEVSLADLRAFQTERLAQGTTAHTINCILAHILNILRQQNEQGLPVDPSVFRLRALPRPESLPRHLSEHEAQTLDAHLLRRLDSPDAIPRLENACFAILAYTGLRASECIDLLIQDVDLTGQRLVVRQGKGMTDRVVYLSELTCRALTRYLSQPEISHAPSAAFFQRPKHSALKYDWLYQHLTTFACAAGVTSLTPHRLRHTLATRLLNRGMAVTRIQKLLGHKHLNTTMIYARVSDATVEADYRDAMRQIELQAMPLSSAALPTDNWPLLPAEPSLTLAVSQGDITLDNSI
jgi:site-specific recombinase XerD